MIFTNYLNIFYNFFFNSLVSYLFHLLYFVWRVGGGGVDFHKKLNFQIEKKLSFHFLHLTFSFYYCSLVVKKQTEQSGLRSDPCSFVVPTFDTKVTEYLCSGWFFFSSEKFRLFN